MRMVLPITIWPFFTTGFSDILDTARIAPSGEETMALKKSTLKMPRLLMVNTPPVICSMVYRPLAEPALISSMSACTSSRLFLSTSRMTGTSRPRGVSTAMPIWISS